MQYYYVHADGSVRGPLIGAEIKNLFSIGTLSKETMVAPEGEEWRPLQDWPDLQQEPGKEHFYRMSTTGQIQIKKVEIAKKTSKCILLKEYAYMPDGSRRKLLLDRALAPDTPVKAIEAFIAAQKDVVEAARFQLEKESIALQQAQTMLEDAQQREKQEMGVSDSASSATPKSSSWHD